MMVVIYIYDDEGMEIDITIKIDYIFGLVTYLLRSCHVGRGSRAHHFPLPCC